MQLTNQQFEEITMKKYKLLCLIIVAIIFPTGCQSGMVKAFSSFVGGAGGAAAGYYACKDKKSSTRNACMLGGAALGTGIGYLVGSTIVSYMQQSDKNTLDNALHTGRPTNWYNPNTGTSFHVMDIRDYESGSCRQFTLSATRRGRATESQKLQSCKQSNGHFI